MKFGEKIDAKNELMKICEEISLNTLKISSSQIAIVKKTPKLTYSINSDVLRDFFFPTMTPR